MRWISFSRLLTLAVVVAGVVAVASIVSTMRGTSSSSATSTTHWDPTSFPNVPVTTQNGDTVHFYDDLLKGKAVAIDFIYTTCKDECPLQTASMVQLQRILGDHVGKDIFFYSITVDPRIDTPEILKEYADKFGVGPGWLFLTGNAADLRQIADKLGVQYSRELLTTDGHGTTLMLGDVPSGEWMQNSAEDDPRFLASTIGSFLGWRNPAPGPSYADAKPLDLDEGGVVFNTRCAGCHTIGRGDEVGPDLAGLTDRRNRTWLEHYIANPDQVLADGDPVASALFNKYHEITMPNLSLDSEDVDAVIAYIAAQSSNGPNAPSP